MIIATIAVISSVLCLLGYLTVPMGTVSFDLMSIILPLLSFFSPYCSLLGLVWLLSVGFSTKSLLVVVPVALGSRLLHRFLRRYIARPSIFTVAICAGWYAIVMYPGNIPFFIFSVLYTMWATNEIARHLVTKEAEIREIQVIREADIREKSPNIERYVISSFLER